MKIYKDGLKWDEIHKLPRFTEDLEYGDLAVLLYIPSTYVRNYVTYMSLNLCGVILLAKKVCDILPSAII